MSGPLIEQPHRETFRIDQACTVVGVSRRTMYNWIKAGKVETVRTAGGSQRVYVDTLWRTPKNTTLPVAVAR